MLDSLAKASIKLHREKRRAYSAAQSHIVNYSRDLIFVDKMAELDEVVENPIKQPIKSKAKRVWNCLQNFVELLWAHRIISLCIFSSFIVINIPRSVFASYPFSCLSSLRTFIIAQKIQN